jgi:hypothetical protein
MKKSVEKIAMLAVVLSVMIGVSACSKGMGGIEETSVIATDNGVMIVDTLTIEATVTAKNAAKRKLTLMSSTGGKTTYKAGPEVVNFDQIKVGDKVNAVVTEEVAVYIGVGAPPSASVSGEVLLSPVGGKPGVVVSETSQVTVVVTAVDVKKRKVTFQLPDGSTKKVKVSKKVDLSNVVIGENLTVVMGEGLALTVTTP